MSTLKKLTELDNKLLSDWKNSDELDETALELQLALRAELLKEEINEKNNITEAEVKQLITRSKQLKDSAEKLRQQLSEKLKSLHKGRRLVQAYQNVKGNQE